MRMSEKQRQFKAFFENEFILKIALAGALVFFLVNMFCKFASGALTSGLGVLLLLICLVVLAIALYRKDKNIMKCMLGAILMWYIKDELSYLGYIVLPSAKTGGVYAGGFGKLFVLLEFLIIALYIMLFINHLIMCNDHNSRNQTIYFSQGIVLVLAVLSVIQTINSWIATGRTFLIVLEIISWQLALIGFLFFIVCVESKLNEFREIRERREAREAAQGY